MIIIPQIYLKNSSVVAPGKITSPILKSDPIVTAKVFKDLGVEAVFIMDLGLVTVGMNPHLPLIKQIRSEVGLAVYVGGGFKSPLTIENYLHNGVDLVVLGSIAYQHPQMLKDISKKFPDKIATHIDVRGGHVTIPGYAVVANKSAADYAEQFLGAGVRHIFYSDTDTEGRITDDAVRQTLEFCRNAKQRIICTSEIATISDIQKLGELRAPRLEGLVLGRALHEDTVELKSAVALANDLALSMTDEATVAEE